MYKFKKAEQVISYLLTAQGRGVNTGPRIELKCNRVVGMFEWTAPLIVFRKPLPTKVSSRIQQRPLYIGNLSGANFPPVDFTCF